MKFVWKGLKFNEFVSGELEASSKEEAVFNLKSEGVIITEITTDEATSNKPAVKKTSSFFAPKIKDEDLLLFTRKFAAMIESGLAIVPALKMLHDQTENPALKEILDDVVNKVNSGVPLSKAIDAYPNLFDNVYVSLVKAGEASGSLDVFLKKIAVNSEKKIKIVRALKAAMMYPIALLSVALIVVVVMMVFVVPVFVEIFSTGGVQLPLPTRVVMAISEFIRSYAMIGLVVGVVVGFKLLTAQIRKDVELRKKIDQRKLNMPVFGLLIQNSIMARFSTVLSNLIAGGVSLIEAMEIARNAISNEYIREAIDQVKRKIYSGQPFAKSLKEAQCFPVTLCGFVEVGEETGKLNDMLETISKFYEDEFDNSVSNFSQLLEPIMIVFLGVVIGFILVAMYMPIFQMGSAVTG
jgi:type IV pilus assembly protein PilC